MVGYEKVNKCVKINTINVLKESLPEIFEDGKINFVKLKASLTGEIIEKEDDRFYLNWAGKGDLFKLIQAPAYGTLKPSKERSIDFENTKNIFIVGENLETLKLLLKPYFERVKMIYIDPPYNTGNDFIYRDDFKEPLRDYLKKTGQMDTEASKLTTNTEASGRYHSDWLNFMYSRLYLARNLLKKDGIIFVSIDDHEVHNLRMIMNEIFGEENFIAQITILTNPKGRVLREHFARSHDYLLVYSRSTLQSELSIAKSEKEITEQYALTDERGSYRLLELRNTHRRFGRFNRPNLYYPLYIDPKDCSIHVDERQGLVKVYPNWEDGFEGCWTWGKEKAARDKHLLVGKRINEAWKIFRKAYATDDSGQTARKKLKTIWTDRKYSTEKGQSTFDELIPGGVFQSPKPVELIKTMLLLCNDPNAIVLDFFAGSGTTGHATWELNREDGGNRSFILVNLAEEVQDENVRREFANVADICIERLRRVSKKYRKEEEQQKLLKSNQDFGFKVFRLDKSNFNLKSEFELEEDKSSEELKKKYLEWLGLWIDEPLIKGWKAIDVVYELILKEGLDMNSKIDELKIKDNNFFNVVDEEQQLEFYASLDAKIAKEAVEEVRTTEYKDKWFIFLDKALTDNDKINLSAFVNLKVI